jgi:predicted small secreted protein
MKKIISIILCIVTMLVLLVGCTTTSGNRVTHGKDVQTFTYAYIWLGDHLVVEGYIDTWRDYDNCDEIQIQIGGKYYLTHYSNVVMIADPSHGSLSYATPGNGFVPEE